MTEFERTIRKLKPRTVKKIGEGRFGARVAVYDNGYKALIKVPLNGRTFRFLDTSPAHKREEAFYRLGELYFPGVVPETYATIMDGFPVSAQMYVPGFHPRQYDDELFDTERADFNGNFKRVLYGAAPRDKWKRLVVLDVIGNSRDRHGKNVLIRPHNPVKLVAIDNGFSLGRTFRGYRNVFHKHLYYGHFHAPAALKDLEFLDLKDIVDAIVPLVDKEHAEHVMRRIEWVLEYPHRLPFRVFSKGAKKSIDFPPYSAYFKRGFRRLPERPILVKAA